MSANIIDEFAEYLSNRHFNAGNLLSKLNAGGRRGAEKTLRDLWEASDLSANDFAEEVAQFYSLPRVPLPALIAAPPLTAGGSEPRKQPAGISATTGTSLTTAQLTKRK